MEEFSRPPTDQEVLFAKQNKVPALVDAVRYGGVEVTMHEAVQINHPPKRKGNAANNKPRPKARKSTTRSDGDASAEDSADSRADEADATSGESDSEEDDDNASGDESSGTSGEDTSSGSDDEEDDGTDSEGDGNQRASEGEDDDAQHKPFSGSKSASADS